jgi:hypothetical protein
MSSICIIIAKYSSSSGSSSQKQSKSELTFAGFNALFQLLDNKIPFLKGKPGLLLRSLSLSLSLVSVWTKQELGCKKNLWRQKYSSVSCPIYNPVTVLVPKGRKEGRKEASSLILGVGWIVHRVELNQS